MSALSAPQVWRGSASSFLGNGDFRSSTTLASPIPGMGSIVRLGQVAIRYNFLLVGLSSLCCGLWIDLVGAAHGSTTAPLATVAMQTLPTNRYPQKESDSAGRPLLLLAAIWQLIQITLPVVMATVPSPPENFPHRRLRSVLMSLHP